MSAKTAYRRNAKRHDLGERETEAFGKRGAKRRELGASGKMGLIEACIKSGRALPTPRLFGLCFCE